jgi:hypothetical protein
MQGASVMLKKGSGMICVLITMAGIVLVMSLLIRYTTYGIDIAHQRIVYEQNYFAVKGLLNYGILLAEKHITQPSLTVAPWLNEYTGILTFSHDDTSITIQANLYTRSENSMAMSYTLPKVSARS